MNTMILLTIILMDFLTGMEFDLFVPSFPELQSYFNTSPFWIEALLSVNFIGYCISLFIIGELGDRYGRKPMLLAGLSTFVLGSLLCLWGSSYPIMLTGRFLQGLGIAAPSILSFLIIADRYPLQHQQRLMAVLNGVMNISVALAPVLGSTIAHYYHWQGNFIALLSLSLLVLGMTLLIIPTDKGMQQTPKPLIAGYWSIFQSKPLMLLISHITLMIVPYWIFVGMSPLLFIKALNVSLTHFGYYQGSLAFVFAIGSFLFGWILNRFQEKRMLIFSCALFTLSIITLAYVTWFNGHDPLFIILAFMPFIMGQIIPSTLLFPVCLNYIPEAKGRVSAIIQGGRLIFCSLSLQIAGYFYKGSFESIGAIMIFFIILSVVTLIGLIQNSAWRSTTKDTVVN